MESDDSGSKLQSQHVDYNNVSPIFDYEKTVTGQDVAESEDDESYNEDTNMELSDTHNTEEEDDDKDLYVEEVSHQHVD